jgi:hypothetical protein
VKAAIVHDFLYATSGSGLWKSRTDGRSRSAAYDRAEADGIFHEALENRGVGPVKRFILWSAVRIGGERGWGKDDARRGPVSEQTFIPDQD